MIAVYRLLDPTTSDVRYVGRTTDPVKRLREHLRRRGRSHRAKWIASLVRTGLAPVMQVIEWVDTNADANARERHWVARLRAEGAALVNATDGGEGTLGLPCLPETRAAISAANMGKTLGRPKSPAHRAAMRASWTAEKREAAALRTARRVGWQHSAAAKAKVGAANRGRTISAAHRAAISAAHKGRPIPSTTRAALILSNRNRPNTPQAEAWREAISASMKAQIASGARTTATRTGSVAWNRIGDRPLTPAEISRRYRVACRERQAVTVGP